MKKSLYFISTIVCVVALSQFMACNDDVDTPGFTINVDITADKTDIEVGDSVKYTVKSTAIDEKGGKAAAYIDEIEWHLIKPYGTTVKDTVIGYSREYSRPVVEFSHKFDKDGTYKVYSGLIGHFGQWIYSGLTDTLTVNVTNKPE